MKSLVLLPIFCIFLNNASSNQVAVVTGETVPPEFERQEGKATQECPFSHQYSIGDAQNCCSSPIKLNDTNIDPKCDGLILRHTDPVTCCSGNNIVCPGDVCRDNREAVQVNYGPNCLAYPNGPNWLGTEFEHISNVPTVYDCLLKCYENDNCEFFVYKDLPSITSGTKECILKNTFTTKKTTPDHLSGMGNPPCPCYQIGIDLDPGIYIQRIPNIDSPILCQSMCSAHQDCKFFTYATLGSGVSYAGDCFLKTTDQNSMPNNALISGKGDCPTV